ncbi:sulfate ABC transporter permease subunit CysW [Kerstersia gyiorum]|uniref:Sulfate/thiosulfate transporter permease subunit n=1 Tax=Kerstersia gyiorum TaxID=206506 RepID=A0A171KQX2_9BURK|nr:sulfate ABC transporter permease subunit CysW [Kerstersia gyiorum]MCO7640122.1 sulfate ABC transporter permease subunit CysW [Pseudomonas sp. S 311-6]KKO71289.1 sulfate/thiosulfate transporter permease subunit [Kerstersia gyiorum]MCP1632658.1 sulfate transport system permease protein [Kerstersia gyiorum]MCP1635811.1 sulfate transport system permease protein [Kerstersia gyiorum]MCP1670780.1 sulfate transport system permease protein [Kerstersia gyiorum]
MQHKHQGWKAWTLIALGVTGAVLLLVLPLLLIFTQALSLGWNTFVSNVLAPDTVHAIKLTLLIAAITVPVNLVFGIMLAWCVTQYRFRGRQFLITLTDIPYAISPVVAGLCYLLVYGLEGLFGEWLYEHDIQLIFAWPGMVMATMFVTAPFVARILIPLMQAQGNDEEHAALTLGASGWQIFRRITLPKIKWGLLYGVAITNARAVGEFGAVSVVSGVIRGKTLTLPLLIQQLNDDNKAVAAFTAAALLTTIALVTLAAKIVMERKDVLLQARSPGSK